MDLPIIRQKLKASVSALIIIPYPYYIYKEIWKNFTAESFAVGAESVADTLRLWGMRRGLKFLLMKLAKSLICQQTW